MSAPLVAESGMEKSDRMQEELRLAKPPAPTALLWRLPPAGRQPLLRCEQELSACIGLLDRMQGEESDGARRRAVAAKQRRSRCGPPHAGGGLGAMKCASKEFGQV